MIRYINPSAGKTRFWFISSFSLLIFSLLLTYYVTTRLQHQMAQITRSNEVVNDLEKTLSYLKDAETGLRGFTIMRDSAYLEPYENSRERITAVDAQLQKNIVDPAQKKDLAMLESFVQKRYDVFQKALDTLQKYDFDYNIFRQRKVGNGKRVMDSTRAHVAAMQAYENKQVTKEQAKLNGLYEAVTIINIATLVICVLLTFYAISTFNKENSARNQANEKAEEYRKRLEARVMELRSANVELTALRNNEKFTSTGRIARTIAHEVRNPLTNINLAVEQLQEDTMHVPGSKEMINMVQRNSLRIHHLITDLLNSTRFAELQFEKVHLQALLDQTLQQAEDRIKLNHIQVTKAYHALDDVAIVDAEKLKVAFLNIIVNAIEAMEPGKGILTIDTTIADDYFTIRIIDNGSGMNAETMARLFEPYFTRKEKGNGLGLTNTQNIILNHKGVLSVESEVGAGTTFIIRLPYKNISDATS